MIKNFKQFLNENLLLEAKANYNWQSIDKSTFNKLENKVNQKSDIIWDNLDFEPEMFLNLLKDDSVKTYYMPSKGVPKKIKTLIFDIARLFDVKESTIEQADIVFCDLPNDGKNTRMRHKIFNLAAIDDTNGIGYADSSSFYPDTLIQDLVNQSGLEKSDFKRIFRNSFNFKAMSPVKKQFIKSQGKNTESSFLKVYDEEAGNRKLLNSFFVNIQPSTLTLQDILKTKKSVMYISTTTLAKKPVFTKLSDIASTGL